jgi:ClpP class serine protease
LLITDIDANRDVIELSNGDVVVAGQLADRDVTEETKRRIQIREVVRAHLDKERELFAQDIKVLSLFFIDEVTKYRDYDREDTLGDYARIFEEEYAAIAEEIIGKLELDAAITAYQEYLCRDEVRVVHQGYFSIDKTKQGGHAPPGCAPPQRFPPRRTGYATDGQTSAWTRTDERSRRSKHRPWPTTTPWPGAPPEPARCANEQAAPAQPAVHPISKAPAAATIPPVLQQITI